MEKNELDIDKNMMWEIIHLKATNRSFCLSYEDNRSQSEKISINGHGLTMVNGMLFIH